MTVVQGFYRRFGKRALDLALTAPVAIALSPLVAATAIAVRASMGSPILFEQRRPGRGGRIFEMRKFRTMTSARGPDGNLLPDEQRLTRVGRFLRSTSLDELPTLYSVLVGDMSLVGPRPLLVQYLPRYSERQARRHEVPPGVTGWAQVNGRNALGWSEKLELDVWYVEHQSLRLDLEILLRTVAVVFSRRGISAAGAATMPEFLGNGPEPSGAARSS